MTIQKLFKEAERARIRESMRKLSAGFTKNAEHHEVSRAKPLSEVTPAEAEANLERIAAEYPGKSIKLSANALEAAGFIDAAQAKRGAA